MPARFAVIFDMDGTLIDNNPYHALAWQEFCRKRGLRLTSEDYQQNISGKPAQMSLNYIFGREMEPDLVKVYASEKEEIYRCLYKPYAKPISGLLRFLDDLKEKEVPMGVATSALPENIDFLWAQLPYLKMYFEVVVDSSMVSNTKPHPEPFLKAAEYLCVEPERCLAFEDSGSGLKSAKAAGMKVAGITTSMSAEEIVQIAHVSMPHYEGLNHNWVKTVLTV
jgi:beta-phosphoglucomutase